MDKKRIFITGMGAVTPIGIGVDAYWDGLASGRCGIVDASEIGTFSQPGLRMALIQDFNPKEHLSTRLTLDLEPYMQYAYTAAEEAVAQSGMDTESDRIGIVMGTALAGIVHIGETGVQFAMNQKAAGPKFLTKAMGNITAAQFSINHKIKGPSLTVTTACSSGGDATTMASLLIRSGMADAVVVMAGEAAVCPTLVQSLLKTGALSKTGESLPFDARRNGFVLGEGGGALVLESEEHMKARGGKPLAELLGCANNTDAFNPVSPDPSGAGASAVMRLALADAGITPDKIGYINAHGTATHLGDITETKAIHMVFDGSSDGTGVGTSNVLVSSTKGATGHMMGAGGITEVIACVKAIQTGILPENAGYAEPDAECDLQIVTKENKNQTIEAAMSNAFGFGGQNSCIIVGKVSE